MGTSKVKIHVNKAIPSVLCAQATLNAGTNGNDAQAYSSIHDKTQFDGYGKEKRKNRDQWD